MDFTIDDEQKALRDAVRGTLSRHTRADDSVGAGPQPFDKDVWQALVETGVPALIWPESDGGFGAGMTELAVAAQELGAGAVQTPLADVIFAGVLVQELGSDDQRAELLGGISDGSVILLPALEPQAVRFAQAATHVIARDGDALYVVEGPQTQGDSVQVEASSGIRLGGDATQALERAQNVATAVLAAEALGAMDAALKMTVDYLKTRKQFGVPLMVFQALTHRAADMYTSVELARSAAYFAAMTMDEDRDDSETMSRVKVVIGKAGRHVGQEAIQLHGGIGMTAEYGVGHLTARLTAIEHTYGGTRAHLAQLSRTLDSHESVDVLG